MKTKQKSGVFKKKTMKNNNKRNENIDNQMEIDLRCW